MTPFSASLSTASFCIRVLRSLYQMMPTSRKTGVRRNEPATRNANPSSEELEHGIVLHPRLAQLVPDDADKQEDGSQEKRAGDQECQSYDPRRGVQRIVERIDIVVADLDVAVPARFLGRRYIGIRLRVGRQ